MDRRQELLKKLRKRDAWITYIKCPICGQDACYREITTLDCDLGEVQEILICRCCGYVRDIHFRKDGTARIEEPPVAGVYYIAFDVEGGRFGHFFEEVTEEDISWFKEVLEDPEVDRDKSYLRKLDLGKS